MKDIPLMEMDGDECFIFPPFYLRESLCGHINEHVEHLKEDLVSAVHDLLVLARAV